MTNLELYKKCLELGLMNMADIMWRIAKDAPEWEVATNRYRAKRKQLLLL